MASARIVVGSVALAVVAILAFATNGRAAQHISDRLIQEAAILEYQDKEREAIARSLEAGVEASPTFAPGYIVGVLQDDRGWLIAGRGSQGKGPDAMRLSESSCSRRIGGKLGPKVIALWEKALATAKPSNMIGLDGETFTFALKGRKTVGFTWSPSLRDQPKMFRLSKLADGMFDACLTGGGLNGLDRQVSELLASM